MAPLTRGRTRANTAGGNIEPLPPAPESNTLTPARPSHSHVRFDQDEEITPTATQEAGSGTDGITKELNNGKVLHVNGTGSARDEIPDSQEEEEEKEEDSDDDAPEAVSMVTGKKEAEKREEGAKRVVEAYVSSQLILGTNDGTKTSIVKRKPIRRSEKNETQS
jgi:hypothetical protein